MSDLKRQNPLHDTLLTEICQHRTCIMTIAWKHVTRRHTHVAWHNMGCIVYRHPKREQCDDDYDIDLFPNTTTNFDCRILSTPCKAPTHKNIHRTQVWVCDDTRKQFVSCSQQDEIQCNTHCISCQSNPCSVFRLKKTF